MLETRGGRKQHLNVYQLGRLRTLMVECHAQVVEGVPMLASAEGLLVERIHSDLPTIGSWTYMLYLHFLLKTGIAELIEGLLSMKENIRMSA